MSHRTYIRTEPPALLTAPPSPHPLTLTVGLSSPAVADLNNYRQARHAWLSCQGAVAEQTRLREAYQRAAVDAMDRLAIAIAESLGESDEFGAVADSSNPHP